jgi:RNA polymerase sigma factor (sigma-70 family)
VEQRAWDERELVRRCKEGSEAAYAELIRQHRQRLLNLAFRLTNSREAAEDVVQDTFIAAFRTMERFEPRPSVGPWLTTIAVRFASRAAHKRGASPDTSLDRMLAAGTDPDAAGGVSSESLAALAADPTTDVDPAAAAEAAEIGSRSPERSRRCLSSTGRPSPATSWGWTTRTPPGRWMSRSTHTRAISCEGLEACGMRWDRA